LVKCHQHLSSFCATYEAEEALAQANKAFSPFNSIGNICFFFIILFFFGFFA